MKTVLFAPGIWTYEENVFAKLFDAIAGAGFDPQFVPIPWSDDRVMGAWTNAWRQALSQHEPRDVIVSAFSAGNVPLLSTIAELPPERQPRGLLLGSLSPYFQEDELWKHCDVSTEWGPRITPVLQGLSFLALAPRITGPVELVVGENENTFVRNRALEAHRHLTHAILTVVPEARHDINHEQYIGTFVSRLQALEQRAA